MNRFHYLFHFIAYYIAWTAGIEFAARGLGCLGALVVMAVVLLQIFWQFTVRKQTHGLFSLILIFITMGTFIDTLFVRNGFIIFASNPFAPYFTPPWMISIWVSFAVLFFSVLGSLFNRYFLLGLLAFFGFSLAYTVGGFMGAATFPHGYLSCFVVGAIWAICLPLCLFVYQRILKYNE